MLTALSATAAAPAGAVPAARCGVSGYSYAGLATAAAVRGVAATVSALARPRVQSGHVAAWVGVGGYGLGPGGRDEWIQVGIAAEPGSRQRLYVEWKRPRGPHRQLWLDDEIALGAGKRLAVIELPGRRSWWRAFVDGRPAGRAVFLPGSHGRFPGLATAESWDGGRAACNRFAYRFAALALLPASRRPAGAPPRTVELEDRGYLVERRERATFIARSEE